MVTETLAKSSPPCSLGDSNPQSFLKLVEVEVLTTELSLDCLRVSTFTQEKPEMGLLNLFITASMPVLKVLLITALGLVLALDRFSLLGEDARKHLNNIVFYVFNPALVSSNLANTITYESMKRLWFMPFNILITFIIGSILGWAVITITKTPKHLRGLVIGCCAAGNLGNLLLIIIPAVCKEKGSPFGAPDVCYTDGMGYASLSMAVGALYLWSYVFNIVRISSRSIASESSISEAGISTEPLLSKNDVPDSEYESEQPTLPSTRIDHKPQVLLLTKLKHRMGELSRKLNLKRMLAPSTTGAIAGFVVGLVPLIRNSVIGGAAPLHVLQDTALLLGDGAIPLLTLIMGANLLKGLRGSGVQKSVIVGIIFVRYIAMPLIGIGVVKGVSQLGLVNDDPLYKFVLLLQFALPPAMNIGTMTQLFGTGESECSVIMLWAYALASAALTFWITVFMWLVA